MEITETLKKKIDKVVAERGWEISLSALNYYFVDLKLNEIKKIVGQTGKFDVAQFDEEFFCEQLREYVSVLINYRKKKIEYQKCKKLYPKQKRFLYHKYLYDFEKMEVLESRIEYNVAKRQFKKYEKYLEMVLSNILGSFNIPQYDKMDFFKNGFDSLISKLLEFHD